MSHATSQLASPPLQGELLPFDAGAAQRTRKSLWVVQHNQLAQKPLPSDLDVHAYRLLSTAISQIDRTSDYSQSKLVSVTFSIDDLRQVFPSYGKTKRLLELVDQAGRKLQHALVSISHGPESFHRVPLVVGFIRERGRVSLEFHNALRPLLLGLELRGSYVRYPLQSVKHLGTDGQYRLYQYLRSMQFRRPPVRVPLEELRSILALGDLYKDWRDLRRRVIEPSVKEIDATTDLNVQWTPVERGRKCIGIDFVITVKSDVGVGPLEMGMAAFLRNLNVNPATASELSRLPGQVLVERVAAWRVKGEKSRQPLGAGLLVAMLRDEGESDPDIFATESYKAALDAAWAEARQAIYMSLTDLQKNVLLDAFKSGLRDQSAARELARLGTEAITLSGVVAAHWRRYLRTAIMDDRSSAPYLPA